MKMKCKCGHIILDRESNLPYKGEIIRDKSFKNFYEKTAILICEFIKSISEGRRQQWIDSFYGRENIDDSNFGVALTILDKASVENGLEIFQCESCGRIVIQKEPEGADIIWFKPEDNDWKDIFEV